MGNAHLPLQDFFMPGNLFTVAPKKEITIIRAGSYWAFKHFFEVRRSFKSLPITMTRMDFVSSSRRPARGTCRKILERRGFSVKVIESSLGYVVKLSARADIPGC
jgi:hypothetical protein